MEGGVNTRPSVEAFFASPQAGAHEARGVLVECDPTPVLLLSPAELQRWLDAYEVERLVRSASRSREPMPAFVVWLGLRYGPRVPAGGRPDKKRDEVDGGG